MADFGGGGHSKRLSVIQGHLNPGKSYSCQDGSGKSSSGAGGGGTGYGGSKKRLQPSAPMSSTKDEVQRAFPKKRFAFQDCSRAIPYCCKVGC